MTLEQAVVVGVALTLATFAGVGALVTWRTLGRAGRSLNELDARMMARAGKISGSAARARERLIDVRGESERALWSVSNLDARLESTRAALADKRAASDRLRASMTHNRALLERIRSGARALVRVIQMRRDFLG